MPDLNSSYSLLDQYIKTESLKKHCYSVESAMLFYADKLGEDKIKWGMTGLLHDLDWEMFPETHPNTAVPVLEKEGYDKDIIEAILGHAYPDRTDVPRNTILAKYLFACDEITGFIMAYSYMKPDGLNSVEPKSIIKKMKDKAFAKNVNRDDILNGVKDIEAELEEHIRNIIFAMKNDVRINEGKSS